MARTSKKKTPGAKSKRRAAEQSGETISLKKASPFVNAPIYDIFHTFERAPDQWGARYVIILSAIILRAAIGLGSFSGQGEKPINGDFEAQRHWMEITTHLPISKWYFYDLQYWGLDYPPLTAYHSWFFGKVGTIINPEWFALDASRGIETSGIKTFMRWTSIISELVVYLPATLQLTSVIGKKFSLGRMDQIIVTAVVVSQPALILIDHGHFQFNSVMLGLFLFAMLDLIKGNYVLASVWFISSILFKQMALYYAPFIFFFILLKLFTPRDWRRKQSWFAVAKTLNVAKLFIIGFTIAITLVVAVLPFILSAELQPHTAFTLLKQIVIRVFPFSRGLFEDKVANFWCTTNLVVKYKQLFTNDQLKRASLALTLASILPPSLLIFFKNVQKANPSPQLIILGFSACAWGFYLFSFQVHEKTVLVPLIPSTLLYLTNDPDTISIVQWVNNVATFSLYPLLKKDGLVLQYGVMVFLINWLIGGLLPRLSDNRLWPNNKNVLWKLIVVLTYAAIAAYHVLDAVVAPPQRYPDLWVILNTTISFGCFSIFYLWTVYRIYGL